MWDIFIILLAVYNCFSIPYYFAFEKDSSLKINDYIEIDDLITILFFLDIILNFRTTYLNPKSGEEIFKGWEIFKYYFFSVRFFFDVISTVPLERMFSGLVT